MDRASSRVTWVVMATRRHSHTTPRSERRQKMKRKRVRRRGDRQEDRYGRYLGGYKERLCGLFIEKRE